jgi:hypothetical protein
VVDRRRLEDDRRLAEGRWLLRLPIRTLPELRQSLSV